MIRVTVFKWWVSEKCKEKKKHISLWWLLRIFFVFHFYKFNYDVCWHEFWGLILFGVHSASWISRLMCFAKYKIFSVMISPDTFSLPLSFSTGLRWYMTQMLDLLLLFYKILRFCFHFCFQSIFCLLLRLSELYCSVLKFTGILLSVISTLLLSPSTGLYLKIPVMAFFRYSFITSTFSFLRVFYFLICHCLLKHFNARLLKHLAPL